MWIVYQCQVPVNLINKFVSYSAGDQLSMGQIVFVDNASWIRYTYKKVHTRLSFEYTHLSLNFKTLKFQETYDFD